MDCVSSVLDDGTEIDIMAAVIKLAPVFQALIPYDFICGVTDCEKTLVTFPPRNPEFKLPPADGAPLKEGSMTKAVVDEGIAKSKNYPKEVFGFPLKVLAIPLKNHSGKTLGALTLALNLSSISNIQEASQRIVAASQQTTATVEELSVSATRLTEDFNAVKESGRKVIDQVNKSDEILQFINSLAVNSNLLGLNAAIEAARAGENGNGFKVVAEEIRKMAVSSASSVKDIKENIIEIAEQTRNMIGKIDNTAELCERQAQATQEISAAMQELAGVAEVVDKAANAL